MKLLLLIGRNVRRSYVRSGLTVLGTMVLVFVMTLVWSVLSFLNAAMTEKSSNFKAIVTERWQIPSQMPFAYADSLGQGAANKPDDVRPDDSMTWQFFGGTMDKANRTRENSLFAFAMQAEKINTMMDDLDSLPADQAADLQALIEKMKDNRQGLALGIDRLRVLNKQVGDRITLFGINYQDIDLEFEILGVVPPGRYDGMAFFNREYLLAALDQYEKTQGKKHALADKTLNLVWLRVPNADTLRKLTDQIEASPDYRNPQVKCETQSSGISAFLEAYSGLIWAMKYVLSPVIFVTLALVIATAISIAVRERRTELAVMKVLGFRPWQLLLLVLGEAAALGLIGGGLSAAGTYVLINIVMGGLKFPIAFFAAFFIPAAAIGWGLALGGSAAVLGSIVPAFGARSVKVAEVFSKVA